MMHDKSSKLLIKCITTYCNMFRNLFFFCIWLDVVLNSRTGDKDQNTKSVDRLSSLIFLAQWFVQWWKVNQDIYENHT